MINEIITLGLAVIGMILTMWFIVFKLTVWRIERLTITIPLNGDDKEIFDRIYAAYSLCDFCGLKKKCTIALINYGASDDFCRTINEIYKNYSFIKITEPSDSIKELHT